MKSKPNILFSLDGFLLHFCLAYYLQPHFDGNFFGLIDINSKPKKFFEEQKLVNFKKNWFLHDHIKKTLQEPDLNYLSNFEKKYKIDLWKHVINERFFYLHNRFYNFSKNEILSILEQELKLFENILNESKPDYFLTFVPVFHHQKLLQDLCRAKGIRVLVVYFTGIRDKMILSDDGATFELKPNSNLNFDKNNHSINKETNVYDSLFSNFLENRNTNFINKLIALKDYLLTSDSELIKSNFMYYGRTKFKVVKDAISLEIKRKKNFHFLQKYAILSPNLNIPYVYFPMNVVEEYNLLHYAPFFTDQLEVIRHVAKSIPVDFTLYVKEHKGARIRGWNSTDYYSEILQIPNVKLIHPNADNDELMKNSKIVATLRGTSAFKSIKFGKPLIVFGDIPFQIMPSVFTVENVTLLPDLIKSALNHNVDPSEYEQYEKIIGDRGFKCNTLEYHIKRNKAFFTGDIFSNVPIYEKDMVQFLDDNKNMLSELVKAHLKIISLETDIPLK
ncbi:hypothetical protein [Nitrosopumilus adriaticus]|uniref:Capsule polysaccharide biosynthesis protein n=1 Tax=Nitrosopumilus adriaticus TaxID=1580092 RepID=A0A0D5C5K7_9ARCH|nr:hypothetical protein [Nitrosopumilus adriaticus]AJW71808.1 hypothetical protein NADRNF5_2135 [Nitrosopumilus adriaticus]